MTVFQKSNTKRELARFILEKVKLQELKSETAIEYLKELNTPSVDNEPMAIIGISCKFPDAETPEEYWENIIHSKDSIKSFPDNRVNDIKRINGDTSNLMKAGFLSEIASFDAEFFNIPPKVALQMDPYHRLLLQVFVEAIERAGYYKKQYSGKNVGVYVGNDHTHRMESSYLSFLSERDFTVLTGSWTGLLASRISYLLNLKGPAMVIDTSCSSSLVAIDNAIKAIRNNDCEEALIGGINLLLHPGEFDGEIQSNRYQVHTFDERAEGTAWGEGVAAILIKPLSSAQRDKDHIFGLIKGIAVNNDGASNGLTSPNSRAQKEVIVKAWERADINPESVSYIEAHGTGTKIGDPIEVKGITEAFNSFTNKRQFCAIGSIKTNIGHTVGAAGLASLIKVVYAMKNNVIPPTNNFELPNPLIDFCNSPIYVQDMAQPWYSNHTPMRAGISSFSLSGTNAHLVLEAAPKINTVKSEDIHLFPISGRDYNLLYKLTNRYIDFLKMNNNLSLKDLCYTAGIGREHYGSRASIICKDVKGLIAGLKGLIELLDSKVEHKQQKTINIDDVTIMLSGYTEKVPKDNHPHIKRKLKQKIDRFIDTKEVSLLQYISNHYVSGIEVDFKLLNGEDAKREPLPAQVFKENRYWDDEFINNNPAVLNYEKGNLDSESTTNKVWDRFYKSSFNLITGKEKTSKLRSFIGWCWAEILGYQELKVNDNFYKLGGDSVTGLRIVQLVNTGLNCEIPLSSLMKNNILLDFSDDVGNNLGSDIGEVDVFLNNKKNNPQVIDKEPINDEVFELSPLQNSIYLANQLTNSLAYNVTGIKKVSTEEKPENIESIFKQLIKRHPSLRTSFIVDEQGLQQKVEPYVNFQLDIIEMLPEVGSILDETINQEIRKYIRPFELAKAPLFRVGYFKSKDDSEYAHIVVDMHHLVTDGASMGILFRDYETIKKGGVLPVIRSNYSDFVVWNKSRMKEPNLLNQKKWWLSQYRDNIPKLNLITDKNRPSVNNYKGAKVYQSLNNDVISDLKLIAQRAETTPYVVMLSAFHALLSRLSGESEIVIGTPISGRNHIDFNDTVGMFVNTLPLRTKSSKDDTFFDLVANVKDLIFSAYDNKEYPIDLLIRELNLERNSGSNPLFNVYFAYQNLDMGLEDKSKETFVEFDNGTAKFDLTVSARETKKGIYMEWEYSKELFYPSSIENISNIFERLLKIIIKSPNDSLRSLQIVDSIENHQKVAKSGSKRSPSIVDNFNNTVENYKNNIAIAMDDQQLTYEELNLISNRIAHLLLDRGVKKGTGVLLFMNRSFDMIASMLGILKAGCYYIPLDPDNPQERLLSIVEDQRDKVLITNQNLDQVFNNQLNYLIINLKNIHLEEYESHNPNVQYSSEDLAYVMYTSGSTGKPKGTLIKQIGIVNLVNSDGVTDINAKDNFLQLSNYSFDGSTFDIYGALLNGAQLTLIHREQILDLNYLANLIEQKKISIFFITTALFNALIETNIEKLINVRKILVGGEQASSYHINKAYKELGPGKIINAYGPTETTVFATAYPIKEIAEKDNIPIGKEFGDIKIYVFNENLQVQPEGFPGELYIGGENVAKGYQDSPILTKENFINNPLNENEILYKTGDLGYRSLDGNIHYLGRIDHQIKLRGFRIELLEIEATALKTKLVSEAHAGIIDDENGGKVLSLWIVPTKEDLNKEELTTELKKYLPNYMVPNVIFKLSKLPLNKNGKIDKTQLPYNLETKKESEQMFNENEKVLLNVWKDVLGLKDIAIEDNFFSIGGDSIKAIQIVARLKGLDMNIVMNDLFLYQTIKSLAPHLKNNRQLQVNQDEIYGDCETSCVQDWHLNSPNSSLNHFNQGVIIEMKNGEMLKGNINHALTMLCKHHDLLRLSVKNGKELYIKEFNNNANEFFHIQEISEALDGDALKMELNNVQSHIQLEGPLIAVGYQKAKTNGKLFIFVHHISVDVVSWSIIIEDFVSLLRNKDHLLPLKTTPFSLWARELKNWANTKALEGDKQYWLNVSETYKNINNNLPILTSPYSYTSNRKVTLNNDLSKSLNTNANYAYGTTVLHLLLTIISSTINHYYSQENLLVNLEGHGREHFSNNIDVNRTVGWFTSTFPALLNNGLTLGNTIKNIKETINNIPRKGIGFGALLNSSDILDKDEKTRIKKLKPSVNFNFLGNQENQDINLDIKVDFLPTDLTVSQDYIMDFILDIIAYQKNGHIVFEFRYPKNLFDEHEFNYFTNLLIENCAKIVSHCLEQTKIEKTASDFRDSNLTESELNDIFDDLQI
ncbi:non-ribosomal peptide synthetase [Shouchella hunanensis]|uniref:Amino acid adenylation domain-containing protein n=1 Tax=Shouchella hunanensis TaxID=766894 RepID=A0ABY7W258_9BACI|nr:non-ribosomal peptide synthetase [Shouchella hunanensis]WDF02035.1 amino acid adenylation domain-containing protein [Shouchella hunanensis]